ncbi:MAG: extensin family protein [Pseudomonadota bacterium]
MPRARLSCLLIVSACLAVSGCGGLVPDGEPGVRPPASGTASASRQRPAIGSPSQPSAGQNSASPACLADLGASGARFSPLPDSYGARGCNQLGTVQLSTVAGDYSQFGISNIGALKCSVAQTFSGWARFGVDRAARQILGSPIARIETMGSYACRNVAGTSRRSAHARAAAIDVSGFVLEDGRRIVLKSDWNGGTAAEREFLRVVHRSACKRFGTVLGPDYNRAHADHFHLEGSGGKFCR